MPLSPDNLAEALEQRWFSRDGGDAPHSAAESADRFAGCVAPWFSQAVSLGFPCATAIPRQAQLAALATVALTTGSPAAAGAQLSVAIALYITGQSFGAGVAQAPSAIPMLTIELTTLFGDLQSPTSARAQRVATACFVLAVTTFVSFPLPPFVAPIS